MAVVGVRAAVTDTANQLLGTTHEPGSTGQKSALITNRSAVAIDLGSASVTSGFGYELPAGESIVVDLRGGESIYAIGPSAGPHRVDILRVGVG